MAKCTTCKTRINIRTGRCLCNFTTPPNSGNKSRGDSSKWCPKCTCRVINGRCMNAKCK